MTDWNWFFSSLAQSAAAIVGVFGAFIITKVLSNQTTYAQKLHRIRELVTGAESIQDRADGRDFDWFNNQTDEEAYNEIDDLLDAGETEDAETIYNRLNFSPFSPRPAVIRQIETRFSTRRQRLEREAAEKLRKQQRARNPFSLDHLHIPEIPLMTPQRVWSVLEREQADIMRILSDAKHQARLIRDMIDSTRGDPESSPLITRSLILVALLFYAGVIYPLSLMPTAGAPVIELSWEALLGALLSLKGALLTAVSIIFTAALAMFLRMNMTLVYPTTALRELTEYSDISAYSEYFKIYLANVEPPSNQDEPEANT